MSRRPRGAFGGHKVPVSCTSCVNLVLLPNAISNAMCYLGTYSKMENILLDNCQQHSFFSRISNRLKQTICTLKHCHVQMELSKGWDSIVVGNFTKRTKFFLRHD